MRRTYTIEKSRGRSCDSLVVELCNIMRMWIGLISDGEYVISIERKKEKRSIRQNNLMWMWFEHIAREWSSATGEVFTREMVKDMYCMKFLPVSTPMGIAGKSTSALHKEEMQEFLNNVQAHAASEYGIELPSPDDEEFELFRDNYNG